MVKLQKIMISNDLYVFSNLIKEAQLSVNAFLLLDEKPALIEAGIVGMGRAIINEINEVIDPSEIRYVFVTHEHPDHIGGLPEVIGEAYNAKVIVHELIAVHVKFMGIYSNLNLVKGGEKIKLGDREIEVVYAPIETHGSIMFYVKPDNIVFSGDYFGQLTLGDWKPYAEGDPNSISKAIIEFHEGLGYNKDDIKKYLSWVAKKPVGLVAPSHGSMINKNLDTVVKNVINSKLKPKEKGSLWKKLFGA